MEHDGRNAMNMANNLINKDIYNIFITQTDTDDPIVRILEDTVKDVIVTRSTTGTTLFTKIGGFPMETSTPKKVITVNDTDGNKLVMTHVSEDQYKLETYAAVDTEVLADNILVDQEIIIKVHKV